MKCAWKEFLSILPARIRPEVDRLGREDLLELRLRMGQPVRLVCLKRHIELSAIANGDDLNYVINAASHYSPWAATSVAQGYLTAQGGHRIGIAGEAVVKEGQITGIKNLSSLCIRVARDFPGIASSVGQPAESFLILGPPSSGKTTFLRDLSRQLAQNQCVCVVDERAELFPNGSAFALGKQMDVLSRCDKPKGIDMVLRTLSPAWIAMDEITSEADCKALILAGWCGVRLIASAHASDTSDLLSRPVYRPLVQTRLFETAIVLRPDKSWRLERMKL